MNAVPITVRAAVEAHAMELAEALWGHGAEARARTLGAWHVVSRIARSDGQAKAWLDRFGIEHYQPMLRELKPVARKRLSHAQRAAGRIVMQPRLVPMLPGYMFVRLDREHDNWQQLRELAGIGGLVCEGGQPVRVPDEMVAGWRGEEVDGAVPGMAPANLVFRCGQKVRIKDGPFAAFTALVDKLFDMPIEQIDADTRIRVVVDIFGRPSPVDLSLGQIEWQG